MNADKIISVLNGSIKVPPFPVIKVGRKKYLGNKDRIALEQGLQNNISKKVEDVKAVRVLKITNSNILVFLVLMGLCTISIQAVLNDNYDDPLSGTMVIKEVERIVVKEIVKEKKVIQKQVVRVPSNTHSGKLVSNPNPNTREEFIKMVAPFAIKYGKQYKVPPAIIIAQACVESGNGNSVLAHSARNYFGHKCFQKDCKAGHCVNRTDDTHKDFFRTYKSLEDCVKAHAEKISSGRYASLVKSNNYKDWAYGLKRLGYATDKNYANTLITTIENYKLTKFN
jgi:hypothetical protein